MSEEDVVETGSDGRQVFYIEDQLTFDAVFPASEFHPEVKVTFKPFTTEEWIAWSSKMAGQLKDLKSRLRSRFYDLITQRVVSWNITRTVDGEAKPVDPKDREALKKIGPAILIAVASKIENSASMLEELQGE